MSRVEEFTLDISPLTQSPRKIWVYLPNSYDSTKKKYDVLYMFDGHNLFYDEYATYGKSWGIKDFLDKNNIDLVVMDRIAIISAMQEWMNTALWYHKRPSGAVRKLFLPGISPQNGLQKY